MQYIFYYSNLSKIIVGVGYTYGDSSGLYNGDTFIAWVLNKIAINAIYLRFLLFLNGANSTFKVKYNY